MSEEINEILKNLRETALNYKKAKKRLSDSLNEIGKQEKKVKVTCDLWSGMEDKDISPDIVASGVSMSKSILDRTKEFNQPSYAAWINENSVNTLGTAVDAFAGAALTGASGIYLGSSYPEPYNELQEIMRQESEQEILANRLRTIDFSLAQEYENAWGSLHKTVDDPTRGALFLMREVVRRVFEHFAPDEKIRDYYSLGNKEKIKRSIRVEYIKDQTHDSWNASTIIENKESLLKIYSHLSKAHKEGDLNENETLGFLLQADAVIKMILNSFNVL